MNAKIVTHLSAEIALRAIRPDLFIMRKEIFARVIHGIIEQLNAGIKIEADALKVIQSAAEDMLVGEFECTYESTLVTGGAFAYIYLLVANTKAQRKGRITLQQPNMVHFHRERLFRVGDSWMRVKN